MAREDEIQLIAYNIWMDDGCCDGHDLDHWIRAEIIWQQQAKSAPVKATAANEQQGGKEPANRSKTFKNRKPR